MLTELSNGIGFGQSTNESFPQFKKQRDTQRAACLSTWRENRKLAGGLWIQRVAETWPLRWTQKPGSICQIPKGNLYGGKSFRKVTQLLGNCYMEGTNSWIIRSKSSPENRNDYENLMTYAASVGMSPFHRQQTTPTPTTNRLERIHKETSFGAGGEWGMG